MQRNFALEFLRITELSALKASHFVGRGNEKKLHQVTSDIVLKELNKMDFNGKIVIGKGHKKLTKKLYHGELVGNGQGPEFDLAIIPLEGVNSCAKGKGDSLSAIAVGNRGAFLYSPEVYMLKIAAGPKCRGVIDIKETATVNIKRVAETLGKQIEDVTVAILDRPRHIPLINEIRTLGARIYLTDNGDIASSIATCDPDSGIDLHVGIGRTNDGVISATALKCLGGDFQGIIMTNNDDLNHSVSKMSNHVVTINDLAKGPVMFCASGITPGPLLDGVKYLKGRRAKTDSIVMRTGSGTIRRVEAIHHLLPSSVRHMVLNWVKKSFLLFLMIFSLNSFASLYDFNYRLEIKNKNKTSFLKGTVTAHMGHQISIVKNNIRVLLNPTYKIDEKTSQFDSKKVQIEGLVFKKNKTKEDLIARELITTSINEMSKMQSKGEKGNIVSLSIKVSPKPLSAEELKNRPQCAPI